MKKILFIILAFVASIGFSNQALAQKEKNQTALYLSCNMDCHSCETKLTELLKFEKGVRDLKCDFNSNTIYVLYKTDSNTNEKLMKAIEKKGYEPKEITKETYDQLIEESKNQHKEHQH